MSLFTSAIFLQIATSRVSTEHGWSSPTYFSHWRSLHQDSIKLTPHEYSRLRRKMSPTVRQRDVSIIESKLVNKNKSCYQNSWKLSQVS